MTPLGDRLASLAVSLILAAIIAAAGWAFTMHSKVAAMEAQQAANQQILDRMSDDIREIRNMIEDEIIRQRGGR